MIAWLDARFPDSVLLHVYPECYHNILHDHRSGKYVIRPRIGRIENISHILWISVPGQRLPLSVHNFFHTYLNPRILFVMWTEIEGKSHFLLHSANLMSG